MSLFKWATDKLCGNPPKGRITGAIVHQTLANNLVSGHPADRVYINPMTADLWRRHMAEKLGRDFADTPIPAQVNGTELHIRDDQPINLVRFEMDSSDGALLVNTLDLSAKQ